MVSLANEVGDLGGHSPIFGRSSKVAVFTFEIDIVNFVYTTLTTEGVPVTKEDANLAYKFTRKNVKSIRDENLRVALGMINGLRYVKGSEKGISSGVKLTQRY